MGGSIPENSTRVSLLGLQVSSDLLRRMISSGGLVAYVQFERGGIFYPVGEAGKGLQVGTPALLWTVEDPETRERVSVRGKSRSRSIGLALELMDLLLSSRCGR